jgi:CspA family cold shock protein
MSDTVRTLGLVKWFNNKVGYGFITELDGDKKEIFVHFSAIKTVDSQYKYLVQGEYVEFDLEKSTNDNHEFHAVNISGIKGGPIMCETRRLSKLAGEDSGDNHEEQVQRRPSSGRPARRPNVKQVDSNDEFVTVEKKQRKAPRPVQKKVPVA